MDNERNNDLPKKNPLSMQIDLDKFSPEQFELATEDEKRQQDVMSESTTFFKDGMVCASSSKTPSPSRAS